MLKKIQTYIHSHRLPSSPARLIVALSGGGDSVALLCILHELGYQLVAAHCNFHLRGKESDRDEKFVQRLCRKLEVPLVIRHFDTTGFAASHHISIEMAARQLRYEWFEALRQEKGAEAIAVAHHADDNAETLLLNLTRGTGLRGLKGMLPKNGYIVRPLLCVSRKELEHFLSLREQDFVTDSTNEETLYKRNKIRHQLLPLLRELNPAVDSCLAETAERMAEAESLYLLAVEQLRHTLCLSLTDGIRINLQQLAAQPAAATLLHEFLRPYGFTAAATGMIFKQLHHGTGASFTAGNYIAAIHRGNLEVRWKPEHVSLRLPREGRTELPGGRCLETEILRRAELPQIPKVPHQVALDAIVLKGDLSVRSIREGDRFQPFGMKGTQLVSDYLTDRHRSVIDKLAALAVCDDEGIVWLVNERAAQRAAITSATQRVLLLTFTLEKTDS